MFGQADAIACTTLAFDIAARHLAIPVSWIGIFSGFAAFKRELTGNCGIAITRSLGYMR